MMCCWILQTNWYILSLIYTITVPNLCQLQVLYESPEKKGVVLRSHGLLPILEILLTNPPREIVLRLLKIVNMVSRLIT